MTTSSPSSTVILSDALLLNRVLTPYHENCRYLKSGAVSVSGQPMSGGVASAACEFEISESCYIDDTGHFNSVEFNICYNQMFYFIAAKAVQSQLFAPFDGWTMQDYWDRQLPNILIYRLSSNFRRSINARRFFGDIEVIKIVERQTGGDAGILIIADTTCRFWDDKGGACHGEVKIAITDAPAKSA